MITRREFLDGHWSAYMLREHEFLELCNYVALRNENMQTCSNVIIDQLMLVCSHFESLVREMYGLTDASDNIGTFLKHMNADPSFDMDLKVKLYRGDESVPDREPLKGCTSSPAWWKAHNDVKHQRTANYVEGTFEHLLDALAALYIANMVYVKQIGDYWHGELGDNTLDEARDVPNSFSELFELDGWTTRHHVAGQNRYFATDEELLRELKRP